MSFKEGCFTGIRIFPREEADKITVELPKTPVLERGLIVPPFQQDREGMIRRMPRYPRDNRTNKGRRVR